MVAKNFKEESFGAEMSEDDDPDSLSIEDLDDDSN